MKTRTFLPVVAVLFASLSLPTQTFAQTFLKNTNQSRKLRSVLAGGSGNLIESNSYCAFIGGGFQNTNKALEYGTLGGGYQNTVSDFYTTVGGGWRNVADGNYATVAGGALNRAIAVKTMVGGGEGNLASAPYAIVGGGQDNTNFGSRGFIGGGLSNSIAPETTNAVIAGGGLNYAAGNASFIGGGFQNTASNLNTAVAGGWLNSAVGDYSFVGGGCNNLAGKNYAMVGGGYDNSATEWAAVVAGGKSNAATDAYATVSGGSNNIASGLYSTVPGGTGCKATNSGAFVWNGMSGVETVSTNNDSFTVRAPGGVRFITTTATNNLDIGNPTTNGVALAAGSGTWTSLSDRNAKSNFEQVDASAILAKVAAMPVLTWNYKAQGESIRHIGPTAQDFKAAFGVGESDIGITTIDADGVALAAIQGLVEELKERDKEIAELKTKSAEVDVLKKKLEMFEERLDSLPPAP